MSGAVAEAGIFKIGKANLQLSVKISNTALEQKRTSESDENFRKTAPPHGTVKLSPAAAAYVKSFMRQLRRIEPKVDHIASIVWVSSQSVRGPKDATWTDKGAGWVLGAYSRAQLPSDVIERVDGIEIVFSVEDSSMLVGKTLDVKDNKFFARD